jgi:hypothetical protein
MQINMPIFHPPPAQRCNLYPALFESVSYCPGDLGRNLEAFFCPRLKVHVRKFGETAALKLLPVLERRCLI